MDTRTLLAIVLSMLVLIAFQFFFAKTAPPPEAPAPAEKGAQAPAQAPAPAPAAKAPAAPALPAPTEMPAVKTIKVETEKYRAEFTTLGAVPQSWTIKEYKDQKDRTKNVSLLRPASPLPLAVGWGGDWKGAQVNFSVRGENLTLDKTNPQGSIVFEYSDGTAFIRRTYTFYHDSYKIDLRDEVSGLPDYMITLGPEFGIYERDGAGFHTGPVLLSGMKRIEPLKEGFFEKIARTFSGKPKIQQEVYTEDLKWIAQEDKYFFAGLVSRTKMDEAKAWFEKDNMLLAFRATQPRVEEFTVYAGPKDIDRLKQLGLGLENVVDFGKFSIIARPILWLLKQIQGLVINWGWAIIILTIVTRIPFIPLINKGQKSMKKLQALQPRMQELKQKYKKDPQRMQRETMELYKKYKVNPMGGCLPILIQIPVFFALYKVLGIAIELRGAPFALWITDLSMKDPYYVLPIVMGVTMLLQQKMTPAAGDPRQQKMMMFMPIIFTFLFLNFASGLVLYWLVNNLLSIAQQVWVNKKAKVED